MHEPTWSRLGDVFHAALDLAPDERGRYLARECGGDTALLDEIVSMLAAHEGATRMRLEDRLIVETGAADPLLGTSIGSYRLVDLLGRGGMGDVYLAERDDEQYEHRVAFKLIRPGLAGRGATERFLRERQILAQLQHPGIAALLDGGVTVDDRPYLVMQYVDGEPITDYCRNRDLPLHRRLELFRTVCDTVQAAHNSLVVHRDLKPANILVTGDGHVRLLDFGIAKLLDETDADLTVSMDRVLSPAHAAPEQVTGGTVTTATDVYALGVLLYELLTDERPFEVDRSSATSIERSILDANPEPPSRRPVRDARRLRGDLDTIVLMALRKEPERRYQSARELGDDVGRYLEGRPVTARGDSLAYRAGKALARHRWAAAATLAVMATVAWALFAVTAESQRRMEERDRAVAEQARADAVVNVIAEVLTRSDPGSTTGDATLSMGDFFTMLGESVDGLEDQPEVQARLRELLAGVYRAHGRRDEWLEAMEHVVAHHEQAGDDERTMAALRHRLAMAVAAAQGPEAAEPLLRESLDRLLFLFGPYHRDVGIASQDLASVLLASDPDEAARLMDHAFAIAQAVGAADSLGMARAFNGLGNVALARGERVAARDHFERSLGLLGPVLGEAHPHVLTVTFNLALTLRHPDELERAESLLDQNRQLLERIHGPMSRIVARHWEALGVVLVLDDRPGEALEAFDRAASVQTLASGPHAAATAAPVVKAGVVELARGRFDEALARFDRVVTMESANAAGGTAPDTLMASFGHSVRAQALYESGRTAEALDVLDGLLPLLDTPAPLGRAWLHAELATVQASLMLAEGRGAEAGRAARRALDERLKEQADLPRLVARNQCLLGAALVADGRPDEARPLFDAFAEDAFACGYLTPLQSRQISDALVAVGL